MVNASSGRKFEIRNTSSIVWLGNLPPGVHFKDLQQHMSQAGSCKRAQVSRNNTGFAVFADAAGAEEAITMLNGSELLGHSILVESYEKTPVAPRQGGGKAMVQKTIQKRKPVVTQAVTKLKITEPASTVWIGNLPQGIGYLQLQRHMSTAGQCKWVHVGQSGKGFAVFASPKDAKNAISALNGSLLSGAWIAVDSYSRSEQGKVTSKTSLGKHRVWGKPKASLPQKSKSGPQGARKIRNTSGTVWLGDLPTGVTYQEVQNHMNQAGTCKRVQLTYGQTGWALFADAQEAQTAILSLNGTLLNGAVISVDAYNKNPSSTSRSRPGSNGARPGNRGGPKSGHVRAKITKPETMAWIGNLATGTTAEDVQELMSQAGTCKRVYMRKNGTAFACMGSAEEVVAAMGALAGFVLNGQAILVDHYEMNKRD